MIKFKDVNGPGAVLLRNAWDQILGWLGDDLIDPQLVKLVKRTMDLAPWLGTNQETEQTLNPQIISTQPASPTLWNQLIDSIDGQIKRETPTGAFFDSRLNFIRRVMDDAPGAKLYIGIGP